MTREEAINKAIELEFGSGNAKSIRAHNSSLVKVAEHLYDLMHHSLPSNLDEAANNYGRDIRLGYPRVMDEIDKYIYNAFKAGAEWMAGQFVLVGGEPTGWFRANDGSEYATGLDLKEPIKLPVDFYVRKK